MYLSRRCFTGRQLIYSSLVASLILLVIGLRYSINAPSNVALFGDSTVPALTTNGSTLPPTLTAGGIPKLVHFIYRNKSIIEAYRSALESCTKFNKDWTIILWTDDAITQFIQRHFPTLSQPFAKFPHKIQRADAVRYLILFAFGGIYMDMDMICHQPLLPALSRHSCFIDRERQHQTQLIHGKQYSAMNSAMGCSAGHPFFQRIIEFVFHPDRVKGKFSFPTTIFDTTGPAMLTRQYDEWQKSRPQLYPVVMLNETYFSPMINPRSGIYGTCRRMLAGRKSADAPAASNREKLCLELQRLGFENSDKLFITNNTVAIHQFTHLGYKDQNTKTFNLTKEFPQVKSYFELEG